jgi:hypothetical protein
VSDPTPTYAANLILLHLGGVVAPEVVAREPDTAKAVMVSRIVDKLAKFLVANNTQFETQEDGSVRVSVQVSLMLREAPKGLAHTKIIFTEAPNA